MSNSFPFWCFTLLLFSFCAFCTKEDEKNHLATQEKNIDAFITKDTADAYRMNRDTVIVVTNKREANRIVWNPGTGNDTIARGDTVLFSYIGYIFSTGRGAIIATNKPELVGSASWPLSIFPGDFGRNAVGTGYYVPGLDAGLTGMRTGEFAYILFTSQYGYGNKEVSTIPKMSSLMFEVTIINVVKKE